jgi:hypothetical protein
MCTIEYAMDFFLMKSILSLVGSLISEKTLDLKPLHITQILNMFNSFLRYSPVVLEGNECREIFQLIYYSLNAIVRYQRDSLIHIIPHFFKILQELLQYFLIKTK